jgi:hypothetical protein
MKTPISQRTAKTNAKKYNDYFSANEQEYSLKTKINKLALFHANSQPQKTLCQAKLEYDMLKNKCANVTLVKIVGTSFYTTVFYSKQMIEKKLFKIYEIC